MPFEENNKKRSLCIKIENFPYFKTPGCEVDSKEIC